MRIHLIAVGNRMPEWVNTAYGEFAGRLPPESRLHLLEIPPGRRGKGADPARAVAEEGERMLAALPKNPYVIALEVEGKAWSSETLAQQFASWQQDGRDVALLVGGPDGLAAACRARADIQWSLSPLTLPHRLVRIVVAEQLYRAWTLLHGHPYHRA